MQGIAQTSERQMLLDSLNKAREKNQGAFNIYVKNTEIEVITGVFRNRITSTQGFEPINFTCNFYLPFQFDFNYVNLKAHEKIFKTNVAVIFTVSKYGSYAVGSGARFSFLLFKKAYLSYQLGIIWCEPGSIHAKDGINYRGLCFHHEFSFTYNISKHFKLSANILHISNGDIFRRIRNNQDVLGIGIGYMF